MAAFWSLHAHVLQYLIRPVKRLMKAIGPGSSNLDVVDVLLNDLAQRSLQADVVTHNAIGLELGLPKGFSVQI